MKPFFKLPSEPAPSNQSYLVTVDVSWSRSPYEWTSPLDTGGNFERTIRVEIPKGEPINEELSRLVRLQLEEELQGQEIEWDFQVIEIERI